MHVKNIQVNYVLIPSYKPYISSEELQDTEESCQQFFIRNFFITQCALQVILRRNSLSPAPCQATEEAGGNLLLLGHAATLDTCSRQLVIGPTRLNISHESLNNI